MDSSYVKYIFENQNWLNLEECLLHMNFLPALHALLHVHYHASAISLSTNMEQKKYFPYFSPLCHVRVHNLFCQ